VELGCLSDTVLLFFFRGRTGESGLVVFSEEIGLLRCILEFGITFIIDLG